MRALPSLQEGTDHCPMSNRPERPAAAVTAEKLSRVRRLTKDFSTGAKKVTSCWYIEICISKAIRNWFVLHPR